MTQGSSDHRRIIRDVPLLAKLGADDLDALAECGTEREYADGDRIVNAGDTDRSLHLIMRGRARICVVSAEGEEATVARISAGECVGEMSLIDGHPRSASVIAEGPTRTFMVGHPEFVAWLAPRPDAALALLETLSLRLRKTDESLTDVFFLDVPHRLAKQLASLSGGKAGAEIRITQAEQASTLGVTRESVNKALNQFKDAGWIEIGRGRVVVDDPGALQAYGQSMG